MKVLISGAGIAGNALAFWLSKIGHEITVVERFSKLRAAGLQVDLRGHGIEVMNRMGLEQAFRSKMAPELGIQIVDGSNKRWAYFPANTSGKGTQSFTSEFEIMRGDLCQLIYDAAKTQTTYRFGTSIESLEQNASSVDVKFNDGSAESFDLVVGADGMNSRTRKMMLGPETPDALHSFKGQYIGYFTSPRPMEKGEDYNATAYIAPGRRGVMTRRQSSKEVQVYLGCTSDNKKLMKATRGNVKEEKEALAEVFQGAGWQMEWILKALHEAEDFYCENTGFVKLDSWSQGRVTVLGDAAYCPSANTGMGTTSAIVGAYILAGEIGEHCAGPSGESSGEGLAMALKEYERIFRPFMTQVQRGLSDKSGGWSLMPASQFGITIMYCIVWIFSTLKLNVLGEYVLREKVDKWKLPDYEELLR